MNIDEYQDRARSTKIYSDDHKIIYPTLGLVGETGEVAECVKKLIRDKNGVKNILPEDLLKLTMEVSDVCWYLANLCSDLNLKLSDVFAMNLQKLADRQARGKLGGSGSNR